MKENDVIWVSIEESDKYELSNYGFVRNKYTKKEKSFTYIKNNKYKAYCIDGIQYLAHRLVAKYFVINNNPEKYNIVNHIDENTYNNAYWNLEWCTNKENLLHSDVFNRISKKQSKYKVAFFATLFFETFQKLNTKLHLKLEKKSKQESI